MDSYKMFFLFVMLLQTTTLFACSGEQKLLLAETATEKSVTTRSGQNVVDVSSNGDSAEPVSKQNTEKDKDDAVSESKLKESAEDTSGETMDEKEHGETSAEGGETTENEEEIVTEPQKPTSSEKKLLFSDPKVDTEVKSILQNPDKVIVFQVESGRKPSKGDIIDGVRELKPSFKLRPKEVNLLKEFFSNEDNYSFSIKRCGFFPNTNFQFVKGESIVKFLFYQSCQVGMLIGPASQKSRKIDVTAVGESLIKLKNDLFPKEENQGDE